MYNRMEVSVEMRKRWAPGDWSGPRMASTGMCGVKVARNSKGRKRGAPGGLGWSDSCKALTKLGKTKGGRACGNVKNVGRQGGSGGVMFRSRCLGGLVTTAWLL